MYILVPGRHHLLTNFQFQYLYTLVQTGMRQSKDLSGQNLELNAEIEGIIFAVTSANHHGTKRNPIPFYIRSMMLQSFAKELPVVSYIYGIDDIGMIDNFAAYTIKQIQHQSDYELDLTVENSIVVCSTPVLFNYQELGYTILPAELSDVTNFSYREQLPWYWVEKIGTVENWEQTPSIIEQIHPTSIDIWKTYGLDKKVRKILNDPILGDDGDLTESRDYNTYVRQMDEIAELKFEETEQFIQSGNVGDIGCAVGSWIKLACETSRLAESDFYGIEVARQLFDICVQRKHNQEFKNPNVFFGQKNAVTNLVFRESSMHTIHTSSLTHEIASYGKEEDLQQFIKNRQQELTQGGIWINRDVIGPENGDREVLMLLNTEDGSNTSFNESFESRDQLKTYLDNLSTFSRFRRFALDFRRHENDQIAYEIATRDGKKYVNIKLADACEFMLTKDYTDNWESEMHERFCFWSFSDWKKHMKKAGFIIQPGSGAYTNPWIKQHRFVGKVKLFEIRGGDLLKMAAPPTNALIVGKKK